MHRPPTIYAVVDIETTGLPEHDYRSGASNFDTQQKASHPVYITEIAAIITAAGQTAATYETAIKCPVEIEPYVTSLNGITQEWCNDTGVEIDKALAGLEDFLIENHCRTLVALNGYAFDCQLLARDGLSRYYTTHDTKLIWIAATHGLKCGANENLGHFYGRVATQAKGHVSSLAWLYSVFIDKAKQQTHRALGDCIMTQKIFETFIDRGIWANVFETI